MNNDAPQVLAVEHVPMTLDAAVESVRRTGSSAWSLFISPHRDHAHHRHLVYQARAATEESLLAFHVTKLSPLGAAVLTEMAQPLLRALPGHKILPALGAIERELRCFTVTDSVKDMSAPQVPLLLHARSWIPGGTYIAELGNTVRSHSAKKPEKSLDHFDPAAANYIAVVAGSTDNNRAGKRIETGLEHLLEHLQPHDVARRPNPHPEWWGSQRSAQIVLAPTRLGSIAHQTIADAAAYDDAPTRVLCAPPRPLEEAK